MAAISLYRVAQEALTAQKYNTEYFQHISIIQLWSCLDPVLLHPGSHTVRQCGGRSTVTAEAEQGN